MALWRVLDKNKRAADTRRQASSTDRIQCNCFICCAVCLKGTKEKPEIKPFIRTIRFRFHLAEREGFEPPDSCPSTVFKTAAFDRSAISPFYLVLRRAGEGAHSSYRSTQYLPLCHLSILFSFKESGRRRAFVVSKYAVLTALPSLHFI